jgi:hypothetical protein
MNYNYISTNYNYRSTNYNYTKKKLLKLVKSVNYLQSEEVAELHYSTPSTFPLLRLNPNPTNRKFLIPQI